MDFREGPSTTGLSGAADVPAGGTMLIIAAAEQQKSGNGKPHHSFNLHGTGPQESTELEGLLLLDPVLFTAHL